MRLISKLSSGPSAKEPIFQIKVKPTRVNIKYELPHSQVHPSFSRKVLAFLGKEDRTSPALGQRRLSISILLQRLITLLCTSHTGQCAPSLKWYKIHTVQPVPPAGGEGTVQGGQARSRGNTLPEVLVPRGRGLGQGRGRRLPQRQGARSSHHVHRGQCHPRGHRAGGALCQPRSHPSSLFPATSPSP